MAFGKDEFGEDFGIGKVPVIFVAHSMGGLVVKKAFLLGQNDENYREVVQSISAMMFLATPHRGTNLAELLNRVLAASFQSPKNFIADLNRSSPALEELNEQFRHVAPRVSIVSFYETLATTVGPKKLMVLEKDSSILGYPQEISKSLNADHHGVCKYPNPQDSNYISVRNALKSLVGRYRVKGANALSSQTMEERKEIERLLGVSQTPEHDLNFYRRHWLPGTCEWLLKEPKIGSWLENTPKGRIAWLTAQPASGKSILATHVINHLQSLGHACQYFFFRFGDQTKRSPSAFIRSIAFQLTNDVPTFRRVLLELSSDGLRLEKTDIAVIWQRIFESILFKMELNDPLYWVIDALDECESPKSVINLLQSISQSQTPIRVLVISRRSEPLSVAFDRFSAPAGVVAIHLDGRTHNASDISSLVEKELKHMRGGDELKRATTKNLLRRAEGNFLWVQLVLEELLRCHTEQSIRETLNDMPDDMSTLYRRMEAAMSNNPRKADRALAKTLLQWTICARWPLTLKELSQALSPEFPEFLDLRRTIQDICGQFIVVDQTSHVTMLHQTARDYLTRTQDLQMSIDMRDGHQRLFLKTITSLFDPTLRAKLGQSQMALQNTDLFFFLYAATSWTYHLRHAYTQSDDTLDLLVKFLRGSYVLTWIHVLALINQLETLIKAAKALASFASRQRKINSTRNPMLHRLLDLELLDSWAIDLVKVVGKFTGHLLSNPAVIHKLIPPFCPERSSLYRQFYQSDIAGLSVSGITNTTWNDNLAKLSVGDGGQAWRISCAGQLVAVLNSAGKILIWNSSNFQKVAVLRHREPVLSMCFNVKGDKFVSYGLKSTKLWSTPSGDLLSSTPSPVDSKAMAIAFADRDTKVVCGSDDRTIRYLRTDEFGAAWQVVDAAILKEHSLPDGTNLNSPMCMAFNGDATQIGVSYRGFPLSVWATTEPRMIGRCKRAKELRADHGRPSTSWFAVDRFTWNPISGHIIGIYKDGCIFKWHPETDENLEARSSADEVAASPDGKLFVTSDSNGTVRVWSFAYFSVVYQLSSSDLVTGLAFSPDSKRFYDLRGPSISAWEPNILIRLSENEESFSDVASEDQSLTSQSHTSEAWVAPFEPVSALAASSRGSLYCMGNEEGTVELLDTRKGSLMQLSKFPNFLGVSHLTWGEDGNDIVAADLGGDVVAKHLVTSPAGLATSKIEVRSLPSPKLELEGRGIQQILVDQHSATVLVICEDRAQVWDSEKAQLRTSGELKSDTARVWLKHPFQHELLLGFGPNDVSLLRLNDLVEAGRCRYQEARPRLTSQTSSDANDIRMLSLAQRTLTLSDEDDVVTTVTKAVLTQDSKHILVEMAQRSQKGTVSRRLMVVATSEISPANGKRADAPLAYLYIPLSIMAKVEVSLGVLPGALLVFLDHDLWMCTYKLGSYDGEALKRHYFIPRDWVSVESLELCCMLADGTFLCPKDGEVAVIRNGLGATDF